MEDEQVVVAQQEPISPADEVSSEEVAEVEAAESAPAEESVETAPTDAGEVPEKKSRIQERIDELTRKNYEAAQEREYWRGKAEALLKPVEEPKPVEAPAFERPAPRQEDFDTYEAFEEAVFDWRYQKRAVQEQYEHQKQVQEESAKKQAEHLDAWADEGEVKYPDFKTVAKNNALPITPFMAGAIMDSEISHDVAYHLGQNPKEAARIAKLNPVSQVREIAKLEFKLQSPMQKASTKAPVPTAPLGGKATPNIKLEDMPYSEYKAFRERQLTGQK